MVYEYGYDGLEIINAIGEFIFEKIKTGKKNKFYKEGSYNFETWKENARGHPEFNLNIKLAFLFKDCDKQKYNAENQKLSLVPIIRLRNFEVCVILEIVILDTKQNKRITYANKKFFKDNPNIDAIFKDERKEFYDNLVNEFNIIKNIEIFKDIKIDNIKNGNLMLTKFSCNEVLELNLKDFKKFILELQETLEKVAIKLNYEKQW